MINIWNYQHKNIKVFCKDNTMYQGYAFDMLDAEEEENENEDSLILQLRDGKIMAFYPSEIKRIEEVIF